MGNTVERVQGRWTDVLTRLGCDESYLRNKMGPCPICGGTTRFRFDNKGGSGSYFCNKCGPGYGIHLAMAYTGMDFKSVASEIDKMDGLEKQKETPQVDPRIRLRKIAQACQRDDGAIAGYFAGRGITLPVPSSIKLYKKMSYFEDGKAKDNFDAMCSIFSDKEGKPASYHVTYLLGGSKAPVDSPKKFMKPAVEAKGGAIRLTDSVPEYLGIAEGIETALAVTQLYGIPCWAAYCANMLEAFVVPTGVKQLGIFADNDASYAGQKAAYVLANRVRLLRPDVEVHVTIPMVTGDDFGDVLSRGMSA